MPKKPQGPDFDPGALCAAALQQDLGLSVTTNDPASFKRILYTHMARVPEHKLRILTGETPNVFLLVRQEAVKQDSTQDAANG